jgi:bifunctional non-homologous end joining protein LigD
MGLQKYWQKRDFKTTPEPRGEVEPVGQTLSFVVQRHAARRLHYDFRLELDGVLKSWAIPKGPNFDPAQKRLAVHVEDHPLSYGDFEGDIPAGEYGGGHVIVWDRGQWRPVGDPHAGLRAGNLKFELEGEKLSGRWALVRMHTREGSKENWLLIKERDEYARSGVQAEITELEPDSVLSGIQGKRRRLAAKTKPTQASAVAASISDPQRLARAKKAPLPESMKPQLATLTETIPTEEDWLHEFKLDGYRVMVRLQNGHASLFTRSGNDWTKKWSGLARACEGLPARDAWLDGEVVALDDAGRISFQLMQNWARAGQNVRLCCYLFDLMYLDGVDLRRTPLRERKQLLRELMQDQPKSGPLLFSEHIQGHGPEVYAQACANQMEGVICKRADSPYHGMRSRDWLKVKCALRQEFVIGGYTEPQGSRSAFGALLLGVYNEQGELEYAGRVGTGFDELTLKEVGRQVTKLESKATHYARPPTGADARGVHWVEPKLVAEVRFGEWTGSGSVRHASFMGLRADKQPGEIRREQPQAVPAVENKPVTVRKNSKGVEEAQVAGVRLTHPGREMFADTGLTKLELARYYEDIAPWILPHLHQRPLTLLRCPGVGAQGKSKGKGNGDDQYCFYQKHANNTTPADVERIEVVDEKSSECYMTVTRLHSLIGLVQMGVLEIHTWGAHGKQLTKPDRIIFDLDPSPEVEWTQVIEGAQLTRALLDELGLHSFVKTTGGKGLHVVVPIKPEHSWDVIKPFSRAIAIHLEVHLPDRFIANMAKKKRTGKIFVDYLRNGWEATAIAAYSTRARPGAPVSVPLAWDELRPDLKSDHFNIERVRQRLARLTEDPWKDYFSCRQRVTAAMLRTFGL